MSCDFGGLRRIAKVVLRGKQIALEPQELTAAAKYAVVISVSLPFTLAYTALLYVALALQEVEQMATQPSAPASKLFLVLLLVVLVVVLPLYVVRIRRARAYGVRLAMDLPPTG